MCKSVQKSSFIFLTTVWIFVFSGSLKAAPILYDFNFDTGSGFITGTFIGDFALGSDVPVTNAQFSFGGVTFDTGAPAQRFDAGAADITGLSTLAFFGGTLMTSTATPGATLGLNTCDGFACFAEWEGIPGLLDGERLETQLGAVTQAVPIPATLVLFGIGLLGLGYQQRRNTVNAT